MHPFPSNWGESAFTYCGSSFSQCDGYDVGISQRARASAGPQAARARRPAPACGPHCSSSICFTGTVLTTCFPRVCFIATAVRRSHSSCINVKLSLQLPVCWHVVVTDSCQESSQQFDIGVSSISTDCIHVQVKNLSTTKSNDLISDFFRGQASRPYIRIGMYIYLKLAE